MKEVLAVCGLFGVYSTNGSALAAPELEIAYDIARHSQRRGRDASGLLLALADRDQCVIKGTMSIGRLLRLRSVQHTLASSSPTAVAMFGHTRLATHGTIEETANNHPLLSPRWTVLHNGWVTNEGAIRRRFAVDTAGPVVATDSFAINLVLEAWSDSGTPDPTPFVDLLEGELTFIAWCTDGRGVIMSNVGNLYRARSGDRVFIASEPAFFPSDLRDSAEQVPLGTVLSIGHEVPGEPGKVTLVEPMARPRPDQDAGVTSPQRTAVEQEMDAAYDRVLAWSKTFDRCVTCVLPTHFPNVDIDSSGRCVWCREYRAPTFAGPEGLRAQLERGLRGRSGPVLVGLSGGRDSCYSLHLVRDLGFDAIAFTYDWGLVTNEARENMARMCGRLGVEHILVARDIEQVKHRLRGGLAAILRTTDLGVVPLLMSGDKSWMHWAQVVARERGDAPIVMGTHRDEATGFKSALATGRKIRSTAEHHSFWKLSAVSLGKMAGRYAAFGVREPRALPILLRDAVPGAWHYYVRQQEIVLPFDFVPWDRDLIESTITSEYGWSFGTTGTKWRAGDGTAVVYNLLYLAGLGFSEMETFLSNQIRSGAMTREAALEMIDNRPHLDLEALVGYLEFIGADVDSSLAGFLDVLRDSPANATDRVPTR